MKSENLVKKVWKEVCFGIAGGIGALSLQGCTAMYEDPIAGGMMGTMPRAVQPGGYRDWKEDKDIITVHTDNGTARTFRLRKGDYITYQGRTYKIDKVKDSVVWVKNFAGMNIYYGIPISELIEK